MGSGSGDEYEPLFETKQAKGRALYRIFAGSIFVNICLVWIYRAIYQIPIFEETIEEGRRGRIKWWCWMGIFGAEIWFGFYWILTQALRWNPIYRRTFKERLFNRYGEDELPGIDIFVCTADPFIEPPIMVINTVLSVMAYDYPTKNLSVYLSDDGGSELTFYALLEASQFAKHWLPYCRKYKVEPRSPAAYFNTLSKIIDIDEDQSSNLMFIQRLYDEMENRIEMMMKLGRVSEEARTQHKGFSEWKSHSSKSDHDTILQILIDGRGSETTDDVRDVEGCRLPTLVYLAREKRPQYFHNFKAGAMNALIRVSSEISNGSIILNVDCDMYSNNSQSIRDALCFFMDEKQSQRIAFVQYPQKFENITKNDLYGSSLRVICEVEMYGIDGSGGPCYIGSGCFHRRDVLCGKMYSKDDKFEWKRILHEEISVHELEENAKCLASCTYEINSPWGKEMGLKYRCAVEDVITGLTIHCRGWKSTYYNPERPAFLGVAPTSLGETLIQHKRWGEGNLQIMLSRHCPLVYGHNMISLIHQFGYLHYHLWAANSFPVLCYSIIPSLCLLNGFSLFPKIFSPWFIPFGYLIIASNIYSLIEFLGAHGTTLGWWNEQRIWLYKRTGSYFIASIDIVLKFIGFSDMKFAITAKVADEDVSKRYEKEIMEFGSSSPMFAILATLGVLNLSCFFLGVVVVKKSLDTGGWMMVVDEMGIQILLCGVLVLINLPIYEAMVFRNDNGKLPWDLTIKSGLLALIIISCFSLLFKTQVL